jgi:hypothetical protein
MVEVDDGIPCPLLEPVIAGNEGIVLVGFAVARCVTADYSGKWANFCFSIRRALRFNM